SKLYSARNNEFVSVNDSSRWSKKGIVRPRDEAAITFIEVGITSQDSLQIVETEKLRKYDLLTNELGLMYVWIGDIIPYVITWDGIVTKYHKTYVKRLQIPMNVEAYIQSISGPNAEESWERASLSVILGAEMHKQPIPPLKQVDNGEDDVKTENTKNILPHILNGITTVKEPTIDTNEELELEEEIEVVEMTRKTPFLSNIKSQEIVREFIQNNESNDPSEVLVIKNESLNVYEKTPIMYESRKKFQKDKRMFVLF
ncbi:hypothetical protein CWI39_0279p0010, partial [Hamiltosporidium magnivora]